MVWAPPNSLSDRHTISLVESDLELLEGLRNGDENAFVVLMSRYEQPLLRFARSMVPSQAVAEEAVQDTWMGVVRGVNQFEGRSTFKTWLFRILVHRAQSAGSREQRYVPLGTEYAVDPSCFDAQGAWAEPVDRWVDESDARIDAATFAPFLKAALDELPPQQRQVVLLRDVEGLTSDDVSGLLDISPGNQRVLLHRGRNRLRDALQESMRER